MDTCIVVRHGSVGSDEELSAQGMNEVENLAATLAPLASGRSVLLLSSAVTRALQTAKIISDKLNVPVEEMDILGCGMETYLTPIQELIETRGASVDVVIFVTHGGYTETIPMILFGKKYPFQEARIRHGQARYVTEKVLRVIS